MNPHLRMVMDRALEEHMPKDTIRRAIARAAGGGEAATAALTLEAYGPGGAALLIDAVTDNRNRTVGDIRRILANHQGSLGESGSVAWQFERRGILTFESIATSDAEALSLAAVDAGASDIERDGPTIEVMTPPEKLRATADTLTAAGHAPQTTQLVNLPKQWLTIGGHAMERLENLVRALEEHDDVVAVTTNAAPPESPDA